MSLLKELSRQKKIYGRCPSCDEEFRIGEARLFDATSKLPEYANAYLSDQRLSLKDGREDLKKRKDRAKNRARITSESVGIGKIVEKIAPSLRGFPVESADCRSLFEPIDYLVFQGLSKNGIVQAIQFVDVKSGGASLNSVQKQVRKVVEAGNVKLLIAPRANENAS